MNSHSKRQSERRRERVRAVQEMKSLGMKQVDMAEILKCSPAAITSYKKDIPPVQEARADQHRRVIQKWQEIEEDNTMTSAEKHLAFARWMRIEIDLTGTAAATKHLHADVTPEHSIEYLKFRKATSGLSDNQLEEVYKFASALPRTYIPPVMDASWWPAPERNALPPVAEMVDEFDPAEVTNEASS